MRYRGRLEIILRKSYIFWELGLTITFDESFQNRWLWKEKKKYLEADAGKILIILVTNMNAHLLCYYVTDTMQSMF